MMMRFWYFAAAGLALLGGAFFSGGLSAEDGKSGQDAEREVAYDRYEYPYFVKNTVSPPEGESVLALPIGSKEDFDEIFGIGMVMGKAPRLIEKDYFKTHAVFAFIEWGNTPWEYTVRAGFRTGRALVFKVSRSGEASRSATFAPRLILGVDRSELDGVNEVIFDFIPAEAPVTETGEQFRLPL
ncbi:MAG: hypothetical protein IJG60_06505 [Thermoguttaceae bacterium]|nr:hypothetical protein [Thermoguttaceae bacterium]